MGRLATTTNPSDSFVYNALGEQVRRVTPSATIDLPYDPNGDTTGFFNGNAGTWWEQQFWEGGRLLGFYDNGNTYFIHRSALGSSVPTQITDAAGGPGGDVTFYPYGQEWKYDNVVDDSWRFYGNFTRYQADTGLHLTPNRFYSPAMGHWLSPDPLGGDVTNPQSLNRYAYVNNNPATLTDTSRLTGGINQWGNYGTCDPAINDMTCPPGCDEFGGGADCPPVCDPEFDVNCGWYCMEFTWFCGVYAFNPYWATLPPPPVPSAGQPPLAGGEDFVGLTPCLPDPSVLIPAIVAGLNATLHPTTPITASDLT